MLRVAIEAGLCEPRLGRQPGIADDCLLLLEYELEGFEDGLFIALRLALGRVLRFDWKTREPEIRAGGGTMPRRRRSSRLYGPEPAIAPGNVTGRVAVC